jgi:hypothetical protein
MGDEDIGAAAMLVSRDGEEVSGNVVEGYSGMLNMNLSLTSASRLPRPSLFVQTKYFVSALRAAIRVLLLSLSMQRV